MIASSSASLYRLLLASLFACIGALGSWAAACAAEQQARPNFVVFLADDMGWSDLGCYGGEVETPNLDRLASRGLRFTQFYNTARCWPTRSALLTGYYPQQIRSDPQRGRFASWTLTLPQVLAPLGYRSYHTGKWHVPGAPEPCADGGFDHSYYLIEYNRNFSPGKHSLDGAPLPPVERGSGYYSTTAITDYALGFLKEHAAEHDQAPFFLYVAYIVPHFPLHALEQDIARYRGKFDQGWPALRAARHARQKEMGLVNCELSEPEPKITAPSGKESDLEILGPGETRHAEPWDSLTEEQKRFQAMKLEIHAAMVDRMDQEIGRVVKQLEAMDALENTVILFLSDNGASAEVMVRGDGHDRSAPPGSADTFLCLGPGGSTVANTPFRRHKIWVHEGGIATPLVVHWPRGIAARGELRHNPGHVINLVPTLLELAGGTEAGQSTHADAPPMPGRSLVPALKNDGTVSHDYLFFHHSGNRALREGDWKLVSAADEADAWELYNLATDRAESKNLAAEQPDRVQAMAARWQALQDEFTRQADAGQPPPQTKGKGKAKESKKAKAKQ
ncbi:MAG: arylsulfatase [Planctomycetota bacterium]